ncbi:MAG: DUF2953 domain-containing protein [Clostridia bacterium]|nr:DUF2953 domain-containing protein [Clostridia bacterium]
MNILIIFSIIFFLLLILMSINVKIEIENLKFIVPKINGRYTNKDSKILLKIYILKKIKIAEINLKKINLNNEKFKNKIQSQIKQEKFNINAINFLKNNNYILEKMNLKIIVGTEDAAITAIGVGIIASLISIFFHNKIFDINKQKYEVLPIYENKSMLKIEFDGIFTFKIANIIGMAKYLKRRVDKNDRTSNRRAYAYSNE